MVARPKLHEIGSLKLSAKVSFAREKVSLGESLRQKTQSQASDSQYVETFRRASFPSDVAAREAPEGFDEDETQAPPVAVLDEALDAELLQSDSFTNISKPSVPLKKTEEHRVLTAADKIEAACAKLDITVRAYLEDELKIRFVGVMEV